MADRGRKGGTEGAKAAPQDALRAAAGADEPGHHGVLAVMREWADALVFAFVLAMFIRMFVVELFKIPSGSMTPALLGDFIAEGDVVFVQENPGPMDGEKVVAWVDGEGMLLKRYKDGALYSGNGRNRWHHNLGPHDKVYGVFCGVHRDA